MYPSFHLTEPLDRGWESSGVDTCIPQSDCVPDAEQRLWRTVTRKKYQLRCDRARLQNQVEALLVTDLLGASVPGGMLKALADGETPVFPPYGSRVRAPSHLPI